MYDAAFPRGESSAGQLRRYQKYAACRNNSIEKLCDGLKAL
jgi:hypothetical protein